MPRDLKAASTVRASTVLTGFSWVAAALGVAGGAAVLAASAD